MVIGTQNQRTVVSCRHQNSRKIGRHNPQGVGTLNPLERFLDSRRQIVVQIFLDQMGQNFGIRLGVELVAQLFEFFTETVIVLDDTVVHDHQPAAAVSMGMGVRFGRCTVGSPPGMAESTIGLDAIGFLDKRFKLG